MSKAHLKSSQKAQPWVLVGMAALFLAALVAGPPAHALAGMNSGELHYLGIDSQQWQLTFRSRLKLRTSLKNPPEDREISAAIQKQIHFLDGPLLQAPHHRLVPAGTLSISNIHVEPIGKHPGLYAVEYDYKGIVLGDTQSPPTLSVTVPLQAETLYLSSLRGVHAGNPNLCTDPEYQTQMDFWHFWSPFRPGCGLEGEVDYVEVDAALTPLTNTARVTAPEYQRMVNSAGELPVSVFFGMNKPSRNGDPYSSQDEGAYSFRQLVLTLSDLGFSPRSHVVGPRIHSPHPIYTIQEFERSFETGPARKIRVRLFFGNTKYQTPETAYFHHALKPALEHDALVIYSGHSGLGRNMNLASIATASQVQIELDPSIYQLFFFDSCNSYEFYNQDYFRRKATASDPTGIHNLDLITTGLEALFETGGPRSTALIQAVTQWADTGKITTYPELLEAFSGDDLTGVAGDEDNPTVTSPPSDKSG